MLLVLALTPEPTAGPSRRCDLSTGCTSIWGSVWGADDITWQRTDNDGAAKGIAFDGTVTPAKLSAWLRALLLHVAMPPVRPFHIMAHHMPCALAAWWRVVERVAQRVPPHWLAGTDVEFALIDFVLMAKYQISRLTFELYGSFWRNLAA